MPIVNHVVLASGAAVAVSVAVATAMAVYESPEVRRYVDDIRRRIAMALHCIGDGIDSPHREPHFNRPEDADGFLQTRRGAGAEPGVDADDETRRRQRDELLYWNRLLMEKKERERQRERELRRSASPGRRGPSFDDFLRQDETADHGTYVFNTGADVRDPGPAGGLRLRGAARPRGLAASTSPYANPFADEYHIGSDEAADAEDDGAMAPGKDEIMSDIYSATTRDAEDLGSPGTLAQSSPALIDVAPGRDARAADSPSSGTLERELSDGEFMTAGQDDRHDAYASIQAWAQESSRDFYSPLPATPAAPMSEPEMVSDGQLTPTDSASVVGSGVDVADEVQSTSEDAGRAGDVMSESEGMLTPASWSEVGSVISESDAHGPMRA